MSFDFFLDHINCLPSVLVGDLGQGLGSTIDTGPPLVGLVLTAELLERGRVSTVERRGPGVGSGRVELWNLQLTERGCGIPEVEACPGHRDRQFDLHRRVQRGTVDRAPELERTLRTAEATLAVDHHRKLVVAARDATVGPELTERCGEVPEAVGRDRGGLAHDTDPAGSTSGAEGVLVGGLRVVVDEHRGCDEVAGHPVGVVLAEGLQLGAGDLVEVARVDLLGDLRVLVTRTDGLGAVRIAVLPVVARTFTEAGAGVTAAVAEALAVVPATAVAVGTATERTVTVALRPVATRAVRSSAERGAVSVATRAITIAGRAVRSVGTVRTVAVASRAVRSIGTVRAVAVASRTIRTEGAVAVASRTIRTERTIPITTRTITVTSRTVRTERTVAVASRTIRTERTVSITTRTITVTSRTVRTERTIPVTRRTVGTERPVPVTSRTVRTERPVPITSRTIRTERTIPVTSRTIRTERTIPITTRTVSTARPVPPGRPARLIAVTAPRRTTVTVAEGPVAVAERATTITSGPTSARTISVAAGRVAPLALTTLEVTGAGRPTISAVTPGRPVAIAPRSVSAVPVVPSLLVVVRHRCSSLRARARARAIVRCVVVSVPHQSPGAPL
ncbi:hypothetical protein [Curtobacterium sp. MCBA15_008]|uniref:hypothetical protein n=1 Tax=Curtobacterium sp. MCBA15_008 TaxID=1898736 RepID=UPI0015873C25|nr:hypothetical protein [Curtobacterium sp. MCBA15_008]